jgi:hypothetical protein
LKAIVERVVDSVGARDEGEITGVPTGFTDLDSLTKGFQAGQLIVLAGRPAMGKSTVALDFARAAAAPLRRRDLPDFPRRTGAARFDRSSGAHGPPAAAPFPERAGDDRVLLSDSVGHGDAPAPEAGGAVALSEPGTTNGTRKQARWR